MTTLLKKISRSLQQDGVLKTAKKVINYPLNALERLHFVKNVLGLGTIEDRFTWIYKNNYWQSKESVSGTGSTLKSTENLRKELPKLIRQLSIKTVFDAPCGDFNWMKHLLPTINVSYIGGDIVRPLIDSHNEKYTSSIHSY